MLKGISLLEYYAGEGFRMHGKTLPSESRDTFTYTMRQPLGVVGLIAPWNFPWAIPVWKSAPALVAGNCVVFKPAELTPATAVLLAEIYEEAGCLRACSTWWSDRPRSARRWSTRPSCARSRSPARTRSAARST